MLRKAMPEIPQNEWFPAKDTEDLRLSKKSEGIERADPCKRRCYLLPYVNLETLSESPAKLLSLMHNRAFHPPSSWVAWDVASHQTVFQLAMVEVAYNPHCVAITLHQHRFGELVAWDVEEAHEWSMVGFPRAYLAFEAQYELAIFLRMMMESLLENTISVTTHASEVWQDTTAGVVNGYLGTVVSYSSQCFSSPLRFSIDRVLELLESRCKTAMDELWLMQTDFLYLRERLARAQSARYYSALPENERLDHLIQQTLGPIRRVDVSRFVFDQVNFLSKSLEHDAGCSVIRQHLPQKHTDALRAIRCILTSQFHSQAADLL